MDSVLFEAIRKTIPKRIDLIFSEGEDRISILFREPYQPIGNENAAFEAWVLYIHNKSPRTKIVMAIPELNIHQYECLHFKRFLYRLANFSAMKYSWFFLSKELEDRVAEFMAEYRSHPKVIRLPHSETAGARGKGERILQNRFIAPDSILQALPECDRAPLHAEFPVDLYWGTKRAHMLPENRVFPGGSGSRLDLWCKPENALSIFHLTYQEPTASMVSKLFFLAYWCRDVFMDNQGSAIIFPRLPTKAYRGFEDFFNPDKSRKPIEVLNANFLADQFHPKLEIDFICEMLSTPQIRFNMLKYSCDMPLKFT
ncbi:hypothetical protein D7Y09_05655 [bacterium 1XD42-1]|nr:hypothetical protein D7X25_10220 [bacterium 1XD42-8]RKJ65828.1 hypothetical protein D7Y09_05655 [bacterium 1XD42-1]